MTKSCPETIAKWHELIVSKDLSQLNSILADEARLFSPVLHRTIEGKKHTAMYLSCAASILCNATFKYVKEVYDDNYAVLEFEAEIDGTYINGVDMITWNSENKITDFKVMIRPAKALALLQQLMAKALNNL